MGVWEKVKQGEAKKQELSSSLCHQVEVQYMEVSREIRASSDKSMKKQLLKHVKEVESRISSLCAKTARRRVLISMWNQVKRAESD